MTTKPPAATPKSTREWSAAQKWEALTEAATIPPADLGAFLRSKGIRTADLDLWRDQALAALADSKPDRRRSEAEQKRIADLERKLDTTARRLRASEALLDLQKKVREIWGDEDSSIPPRSEP